MVESPQSIQVARDGVVSDAAIAWRHDPGEWVVELTSPEIGRAEARADDAFEALCVIRDGLEPRGWRVGVLGAQADVWPSGMSRDQGGGLTAYRMDAGLAGAVVDTFGPVDPATVTTLARQRARSAGGDATAGLVGALVDTLTGPGGRADDGQWESMAIVLELPGGEFNEAHGYLYLPDGAVVPVASDPWVVALAVTTFTDSHYELGERLPRAILLQLERTTGRYAVTFEETDETRWRATPRNHRQLREEMRPRFD